MRSVSRVVRAVVILALAAGCGRSRPTPAALTPSDVAAITAVGEAYRTAWLAGDSAAVMRLFTPDAVLLPHDGDPRVVGSEAIRRFWWPPGSPPTTLTELTVTTDEVGGEGGLAHSTGRFRIAFSYEHEGRRWNVRNAGTFLMLFRKQWDGSWRITHRMWDDPPAERT